MTTTPPGLYTIRIKGRLGATALSAFPTMAPEVEGSDTVLTGWLTDRSAVFGVLVVERAHEATFRRRRPAATPVGACQDERLTAVTLEVPFEHRGQPGTVRATVQRNEDPARWGHRIEDFGEHLRLATDFPACHAVVDHPAEGYDRLMGWVQVVWSGPPGSVAGEFDPWAAFADLDLPYCWFGFAPELFDAPFRGDRSRDLDWEAHSWLCTSPGSLLAREVAVLAGFRWGFQIQTGQVVIAGPAGLELHAWTGDLPILERQFPNWRFAPAP